MRDCSTIYFLLSTSWYQISGLDFVTRPLIQTSCSVLWWCIVFIPHAPHLMPGHNRTRYNYLLSTSFLHSDYSLWSTSGLRRNSLSDESRTHIQPFIRTHPRKPAGLSRVTSRPSTLVLLPQYICCDVTLQLGGPGRSWCWRPKGQAWPRPASRLLTTLLVALPPVAFLCRA